MKLKLLSASLLVIPINTSANELNDASSSVSMNVGLYASISGLDDFSLTTSGTDGSANAIYSGSDTYQLESNGQIRVTLTGSDLSNGSDSISTNYSLDGSGLTFDTAADSAHNASHSISATATLGEISAQKAGSYTGTITITVSGI
ncbi:hypothetical protein [Candidatus Sororendozoicomonas aggregata]|uniref:hypothetical protein n=1 Tax=Candidatus Sororendozoicomonas aggregata TaxID=3073239 RepID=UPI002ED40685